MTWYQKRYSILKSHFQTAKGVHTFIDKSRIKYLLPLLCNFPWRYTQWIAIQSKLLEASQHAEGIWEHCDMVEADVQVLQALQITNWAWKLP